MPKPELTERQQSGAEGIRDALDIALEKNASVFLIGEGVADPKGIFGTTTGLIDKYGSQRVVETPIAENGFTGVAIGAAMMGQRPVVIHQRVEFALLAMEQIVNNAAKTHYVSDGAHSLPMVVRLVVGRGWGQGPLHSQSLETLFGYVPGLKVLMPATAEDCKGMLLSAIEDNNPVIFLEHRWVHYVQGRVPTGYHLSPIDGPKRLWRGEKVTVVSSSYMTLEAIQAARALSEQGCEIDLFDLRVLRPLKLDDVIESVRRTGRLLVVDTGWKILGPGAEIVAQVVERCFEALQAPPQRLGLPDHPTPSSKSLAAAFYVRAEDIAIAAGVLAELSRGAIERAASKLSAERQSHPIDVPHPSFQGPF
ncbi:MAG: transketolase C-terminal domain-containing protein [Gammaproteobacteria bacterium]